jgi:tetratricopeptide (TPR) repeat protein
MTGKSFIVLLFVSVSVFAQDKKTLILFEKAKKDFMERKYDSALENFEKYLEKDSSKTEAYFRIAQIHESFRNQKKATAFYLKVIEKDTSAI